MADFVKVTYAQTGKSQSLDAMGMRAMQQRAYQDRGAQYLLVKAPPASGKSRALMFIGLDKLQNQGLKKVIVAVPERSIGASFRSTNLSADGFFRDWTVDPQWDLCTAGGDQGKVGAFKDFMASSAEILVCTHATLRFAFEQLGAERFAETVVAIDEFHHASADAGSKLGEAVRALMQDGRPHIVAMTGSYFRGDAIPVLRPEDEEKFTRVSYTYYEQLNGYKDLKTLGIGYHFYRGSYLDAIKDVLDPTKKTIIHIPSVNSAESVGGTDAKYENVNRIVDCLGTTQGRDTTSGLINVRRPDGTMLRVADLVDDGPGRETVMATLRTIKAPGDVDVIIALGMAKEGFDWPYCEHALTVGYRGSLTEIIQIIGRATRDAPGKSHAQFTNLIAEPDTSSETVAGAVNNMLKAIACSLLMEQVLAPNFKFRTRRDGDTFEGLSPGTPATSASAFTPTPADADIVYTQEDNTISIKGFSEASTPATRQILESDMADLTAAIFQDPGVLRAAMSPEIAPEVVTQVFIPKIIATKYPELSRDEVEEVRQHIVANAVLKSTDAGQSNGDDGLPRDSRFIKMAGKFIKVDELDMDLIDSINPFQLAYEIMSTSVTAGVLKRIHESIVATKIAMTEEEAVTLWPRITAFKKERGSDPSLTSANALERRMAEALAWIREAKRRKLQAGS